MRPQADVVQLQECDGERAPVSLPVEGGGRSCGPINPGPASFAFVAVVPVALVLVGLGALALPQVISTPRPGESGLRFFRGEVVLPEPLEQARYLLFLLGAPAVVASSVVMARLTRRFSLSTRLLLASSVVVEIFVAATVILWMGRQAEYEYFSGRVLLLAAVAAMAMVSALFWFRPPSVPLATWSDRRVAAVCAVALAGSVTVIGLLPSLFNEANVAESLRLVHFHVPFTMDEFAAVANGRTPLVDFVAQYSNVLPYLLSPALSIIGFNIGTFTALMFVLSGASLLSIFYVFARVSGRWVTGLALYIPFLTLSLYRMESEGNQHGFVANYFAAMPLRYFGPWLVAGLVVWRLRRASRRRLAVLFVVAGAVLINNPDFGLPSFVAAVAATWLSGGRTAMRSTAWARTVLVGAAAGVGLVIGGVVAVSLLRTGQLPDFGISLYFPRQFALSGYFMLPMPSSGLHLVAGVTIAGALVRAVFRGASPQHQGEQDQLLTASLAYGAIFALGTSSYFVGRSHPQVLVLLFSTWAFVLALLMWDAWTDVRRASGPTSTARVLWAIPSLLVAGHLFLAVAPAWEMRDVGQQLSRISDAGGPARRPDELASFVRRNTELAGFVRRHADPDEKVLILAPLSHRAALRAGVRDVFPYNSVRSVVTLEQLEVVRTRLRGEDVTKVFTGLPPAPEVQDFLRSEGFRPTTAADDFRRPVLWQPADRN